MIRARIAAVCALAILVAGACAPPTQLTPAQQVDQIMDFVEQARGHLFTTPPTVEFLDDASFSAAVLANLNASQADVTADGVAFAALGWIAPGEDLFADYRLAFGHGVVGFYDPVSGALKLRGTDLTPYRREVIAHELTHALDDQIQDLSGLSATGLVDDAGLAALVAVEGSAVRVQQAYYSSMSPLDQVADLGEQLSAGSDPTLFNVPVALLSLTTAPYLRGATFQAELVAALGNPAGPDLSLSRLPADTAQAFDTPRYLANRASTPLPAPPTDGGAPAVRSGVFGPLGLSLMLREGLVLDTLDPATAGWAGGAYTTWSSSGHDCIRVDESTDTVLQASALAAALDSWASRHPGGSVVTTGVTSVRVTRCT